MTPHQSCSVKSNGLVFHRIEFLVQVLSDQYGQNDQTDHNDQNDHPAQLNEILNDDSLGHSNHNNDNPIIEKLTNTKDIHNPELSSLAKNNSVSILVQYYSNSIPHKLWRNSNVLCQVGVTTMIAKFLILDIPIDRDAPIVVGRGFLYTMGSILNTPERLFLTFDGVCHQTFRAIRFDVLRTTESDSDDEEEYVIKRNKFGAPIYGPKPAPYLNYTNPEDRSSAIQTIRAFNINVPIYAELCHEFYSTYEFDEVCADDELQSKKIIKFRLGGRVHSLILLNVVRRLGLYQAVELEEDGFNVYFEGGLRNDDNFNAQEYWLSIHREENLSLSRSHTSTIRNLILRTSKWVCKCSLGDCEIDEEEKNWDSERESNLLWDLDTITLRDLIDSKGKLIPEDPQPGVPRVGIPRPPRASMQDLYDRMGSLQPAWLSSAVVWPVLTAVPTSTTTVPATAAAAG
ncbi:hypothetical protein Tco_1317466 [Tanacetum coccineum]